MSLESSLDNGNAGTLTQQINQIFRSEIEQIRRTQGLGLTWSAGSNLGPDTSNMTPADTQNALLPPDAGNHLPITFNSIYPHESAAAHAGAGDPPANSHAVTIQEFPQAAKRVLNEVDVNHDGHITKPELAKAMENRKITGTDAQVLAALYQNFDGLQNLSHHRGIGDIMPSITNGDIDQFKALPQVKFEAADKADEMLYWADRHLPKLDTQHKGFVSKSDIENALHNPNVSGEDRRMLEYTRAHFEQIENSGKGKHLGISRYQFNDYVEKILLNDDQTKMINSIEGTCWSVNQQHQNGDNTHALFANERNPLDSIRPEAIRQGAIGDCYFESALASMAGSPEGRQKILDMMHDNHDGTCTVTFPGASREPFKVKLPTEAELGIYNHNSPYGVWASTIEKAAGEYSAKHPRDLEQILDHTPQEGVSHGGFEDWSIRLLTGHRTSTYTLHADVPDERQYVQSREEVAKGIEWALTSKPQRIIVASTEAHNGQKQSPDGFALDHSSTIVGFTPGGPGGGEVTIRNPWAGHNGTTDGLVSITLDKFMRNFKNMRVEYP